MAPEQSECVPGDPAECAAGAAAAMQAVRRLRALVLRLSMGITVIAAAIASPFSAVVAQSILLGGVAGALGFYVAARYGPLASLRADRLKFFAIKWSVVRMGIYAVALVKAYRLDPVYLRGFCAAVAGLLATRVVIALVGVTGWDLKKAHK
jgi:hypothetical protein